MVTGPWWAALVIAVFGATAATVSAGAWPSKLPDILQEAKERWEKAHKRATKTNAGKFMWGAVRSATIALVLWQVVPFEVGGFLRWGMVAGASIGAGFFGVRPAAWAGILLFLVAHRLALSGLGVDFGSPAARETFWIAWSGGAVISWWWPIGFGLMPLAWVGAAAAGGVLSTKLAEELEDRQAAAEARRKIEERRARMREREKAEEIDMVAEATLATASAIKKVEHATNTTLGFSLGGSAAAPVEMTPVEKIQHEVSMDRLQAWTKIVQKLNEDEQHGNDVDTPNRRSFDRVVQNLSQGDLAILRSSEWGKDLLAYYNRICRTESQAVGTAEGQVVSTTGRSVDLEQDLSVAAPLPTRSATADRPADPAPVEASEPELDEEQGASIPTFFSRRSLSAEASNGLKTALSKASQEAMLKAAQTAGEAAAEEEEEWDVFDRKKPAISANEPSRAPLAVVQPAEAATPDTTVTSEWPRADGPDPEAEHVVADGMTPTRGDFEDLRVKAVLMIAGQHDRDFVLSTMDLFSDAAAVAQAGGVPESIVAASFAAFEQKAGLARVERSLPSLIEQQDRVGLRDALASLDHGAEVWACDPEALEVARASVHSWEDAEKRRIEAEAEAQRRAAEEEALAEQRAAEERRAQEEVERLRAEQDALEAKRNSFAAQILVGRITKEILEVAHLFPDVAAMASALNIEVGPDMTEPFERFVKARKAREAWGQLRSLIDDDGTYVEDVRRMIAQPALFEGWTEAGISLELAQKWADGFEARAQMVDMSMDQATMLKAAESGVVLRKILRQRLGTPEVLATIVDKDLPDALVAVRKIDEAISAVGNSDALLTAKREALATAGAAAAKLLAEPEKTKEYARKFFPLALCEVGKDAWETIVAVAQHAPLKGCVASAPSAAPRKPLLNLDNRREAPQPEVDCLDPLEQIARIQRSSFKTIDAFERDLKRMAATYWGLPDVPAESYGGEDLRIYFPHGPAGKNQGRLGIKIYLQKMPVWYEETSDTVFWLTAEGEVIKRLGADLVADMDHIMIPRNAREHTRGVLLTSPWITEQGISSFAPLTRKTQRGPLAFANIITLNDQVFSAFVGSITKA